MKNYLVTIKIGKVITNKLVKAETAEEAEKKCSVNKVNGRKCTKSSERRKYTHVWKENLNNDY
jgi:hypothetical protein